MADNYLLLSFAFNALPDERALLIECLEVAAALDAGTPEETNATSLADRSEAFRKAFPPDGHEGDPCNGFLHALFGDPDFPTFGADIQTSETGEVWVSGDQADPDAIAELIRRTCPSILPFGFEWATTCSKLRVGEFGGGYIVITKDAIHGGSTAHLLGDAMTKIEADV